MKLKEKLAKEYDKTRAIEGMNVQSIYLAGFEKARELVQSALEDPRPQMHQLNLLGFIKKLGEEEV